MSPRTKIETEKIRQKRRMQIILTALETFAHSGYHRTSISALAKKARISKGLIYNYFKSKEDILISVLEFVLPKAVDAIFNKIAEKSKVLSPDELMVYGIERFIEVMEEQADLWKLSMSLAMQVADMPEVHRTFVQMYEFTFRQVEQLLNNAGVPDASVKARLITAQLDGIAFHYLVMGDNYELEAVKKTLIREIIPNPAK